MFETVYNINTTVFLPSGGKRNNTYLSCGPGDLSWGASLPWEGEGASGARTVAPVRWSRPAAATSGAPCGSPSVGKVGRGFCEEVRRNQAPHAIEFSHVETIIVHISVDVDDVPSLKLQLHLQYSEQTLDLPLTVPW